MRDRFGRLHVRMLPLILAVMTSFALPGVLDAQSTWYVSPFGDDANDCMDPATPCATINGGIGKAAAGDMVLVTVGTYVDTGSAVVEINKDLLLAGGWDLNFTNPFSGTSIVDAEGVRAGMHVGAVQAYVQQFVFRNGVRAPLSMGAGGVTNAGHLTLWSCTVEHNTGGGIQNSGTLRLRGTTVNDNQNSTGGGGIDNLQDSTLTLDNSTVSGNHASSEGGGIKMGSGTVSLNSSTIANNSAAFGGGGVANRSGGTLIFQNTILSGNTANFGPDCWDTVSGTFVSQGYNLVNNPVYCNFALGPGDLVYVDPLLESLLDNGGFTKTHALAPLSPAVDAGNPAGCTDGEGIELFDDQRGGDRISGTACDIGAYELKASLCDLSLRYESGQLTLGFNIGIEEPTRWSARLFYLGDEKLLWSIALPAVYPPVSFDVPIQGFPSLGRIGVLTTAATSAGIICSDWETVSTGPIQSGAAAEEALRRLKKTPLSPTVR